VRDGEPVWSQAIGAELLAAPTVAGDSVYASTTTGVTFRIRRASGALVWARHLDATTVPWVAGDQLYVTRQLDNHEQPVVVAATTRGTCRPI
jgi:outer membrane protein assembly factor BamB